jgi:hypothetical protein
MQESFIVLKRNSETGYSMSLMEMGFIPRFKKKKKKKRKKKMYSIVL